MYRRTLLAAISLWISVGLTSLDDPAKTVEDPKPSQRGDQADRQLPEGAIARLGTGRAEPTAYLSYQRMIVLPPIGDGFCVATENALEEWDSKTLKKLRCVPITEGSGLQISAAAKATSAKLAVVAAQKPPSLFGSLFSSPQSIRSQLFLVDMREKEWKVTPLVSQVDLVDVAITPDGSEVIGSTSSKGLFIWSAADGKLLRQIPVEGKTNGQVELTPDGQSLMVVRYANNKKNDAAVMQFDYASGQQQKTINDLNTQYPRAVLSSDGKTLVLGCQDHVAVHDRASGTVKKLTFTNAEEYKEFGGARLVAISPDGRKIAALIYGVGLHVWTLNEDKPAQILPTPTLYTTVLFFTPNNALVSSVNGQLCDMDKQPNLFVTGASTHTDEIIDVAFSQSDHRIWTIDRTSICRWNSRTFTAEQFAQPGHGLHLICEPQNSLINRNYTDKANACSVIDLSTGKRRKVPIPELHTDALLAPNGKAVIGRSKNMDEMVAWSLETGQQLSKFPCNLMNEPCFTPDGGSVIVNAERDNMMLDSSLRTYNITSGECTREWQWQERRNKWGARTDAVAISADGRRVWASQEFRRKMRVVETATGESAATWPIERDLGTRTAMSVSPDGRWIAAPASLKENDYFHTVEIFDAFTGKHLASWKTEARFHIKMAFSPDSSMLVTSGTTPLVWDLTRFRKSPANKPLDDAAIQQLWSDLDGDAPKAFQALQKWLDSPNAAIAHLSQMLKPVPRQAAPQDVEKLIALLDSDSFAEREKAEKQLAANGFGAQTALLKAVEAKPSAEAKRRIERLLSRMTGSVRQTDRALELLELIGTPAARDLLAKLADGEPGARITIDAKAGVERLDKRKW